MLSSDDIKKLAGIHAAQFVQPGMTIGIGTGTTAYWCIMELGKRVKEGLSFRAVPTSAHTKLLAASQDIALLELNDTSSLDLTIDGADEIDPQLQLIKGGGGALLQEKMVAAASKQLSIIADHTKMVTQLGRFPLPVEIIPYGSNQVKKQVAQLYSIEAVVRVKNGQPFITDHGHNILDCHFGKIKDAAALNSALHQIPGVVETGLFINMATRVIVGYPDGMVKEIEKT